MRQVTTDEAFEIINQEAPHLLPEAGSDAEDRWIEAGSPLPKKALRVLKLEITDYPVSEWEGRVRRPSY